MGIKPNHHHPIRNSYSQGIYEGATKTQVVRFLTLLVVALLSYSWLPSVVKKSSSKVAYSPYDKPFCDAAGKCGENPQVPSPRTVFSAKSREQYHDWWTVHAALNRSAAEYTVRRQQSGNQHRRALILLGDSITESWVGTNMGHSESRTQGIPAVLSEFFKHDLDPLVLGIGGDQTQHLLYRLQNGELLPDFANDEQAIFVVLIGTNNLGSGELPGPTSVGVLAVADHLLKNTKGKLLLMQLLPRGDSERVARLCPPRCDSQGKPFKSFMPAIKKVNNAINNDVPELLKQYGAHRLSVLNCGSEFLQEGAGSSKLVDSGLMPDRLHPNDMGHRILAKCILDSIR